MEANPQPDKQKQVRRKREPTQTQRVDIEAFVDEKDTLRVAVGLPDTGGEAPPMDIVCIVDISYSMCGSAACQTDGKTEYEDLGFSLLDLVKHAVKTVVKAMRPIDRLSIVLFDNQIMVPYPLTQLTDNMREEMLKFVGGIRQRNSTNIWDALVKGIDIISERPKAENNNAAVLFFTDGQPNNGMYQSEKDIVENIAIYGQKKNFKYPIHTFAFGQYRNCTSSMLFQVSAAFEGMFGYIQDAKTVGTIFINGIAYTLCTAAQSGMLQVELDGKIIKPNHEFQEKNGAIQIPGLRYGQTCDMLFDVKDLLKKDSKLTVTISTVNKGRQEFPAIKDVEIQKCQVQENFDHQMRFECVALFRKILADFKNHNGVENLKKEAEAFVAKLKGLDSDTEFITGLIDTTDRQTVTMLVKVKYVEKWGEHQIRHLIRSLLMQIKGNFREQCLKDFGGDMFNDLADTADDIYNNMDPPTASLAAQKPQAAAQIQNATQFAAKMNNFDDDDDGGYYGGGCFSGDNSIRMVDGSVKLVKDLVKGDQIGTPDGEGATVKCVVRTQTSRGIADMCQLDNGLLITPGHPIRKENQWIYPRDVAERKTFNCDAFYNLVVDQGHIAIVNGVELILLGHGFTEGILKHEYLGSQRVVSDLEIMPGFKNGLVQLQQGEDGRIKKDTKRMVEFNPHTADSVKI